MPTFPAHGAILLIACMLAASGARAFSDPHAYADDAEVGGGGGRWFTGSPSDGYSCKVCHTGNSGVDIVVSGLPLAGYVDGTAYEVSLFWPETVQRIAVIAEFTDEQRRGAGQLALPRPEALQVSDLCSAEQGGIPGTEVHQVQAGRNIVSLIDCGAKRLRFQWIAPPSAAGPIWFSAGCVFSNQDGTPEADGVTVVRRALRPQGQTAERQIASSCNVMHVATQRAGSLGLGWLAILILGLRANALAQRRRRGT
jgi:hypothetical protein